MGISYARTLRPVFSVTSAKVGVVLLSAMALTMIMGSVLTPYDPESPSSVANVGPNFNHIFGTDWLGHDLFSQIVWGSYSSLFVALIGALGSVILGLFVGVGAGYFPRLRGILSGAGDVIMVFPALPLLALLGSVQLASNIFIASLMLLILWPVVARVVRNQVAALKKQPYVEAARTSGAGNREIIFGIIIPEVAPIAIAYFILNTSLAIILTVALEFLGVGNPALVSWGSVLFWAQRYAFIAGAWWWVFFPGLFIALTSTSFALIGFAIEETVNPRLRA